jgi:hypothetical protein
MSLALYKYITILSNTPVKGSVNTKFVLFQIFFLIVFFVTWVLEGVFFTKHFMNPDLYQPIKTIVIIDAIGIATDMINFLIIAFVIYRSSLVKVQESDVSLISYLRY